MRILVADDDPDIRALAVRAIGQEFSGEAEIVEIPDQAALDRALASGSQPSLLVSDYSLGWADGFAILNAVRALYPHCPAVMFTGTGNEELAVRALKAGFADYIVKSERQLRRLATTCRAVVERAAERSAHEQNRDLLTQELYHRLHNNLQLVIGLMAFTARSVMDLDARAKIEDLSRRVRSLALLQEQLYRGQDWRSVDFKAFLATLVDDLVALDARPIALSVRLEEVRLRVDLAVPLALIANELLRNTLRHAFVGRAEGRVEITLQARDEGGAVLEVVDDGIGSAGIGGKETSPGLGTGLIRRLAQQIGAEVASGPGENGGTRCRVTVPA
jgi:two-component sensor histidine kinase